MERHFLVGISHNPDALHGVRFLGGFFNRKDDIRLTLLYLGNQPAMARRRFLDFEERSLVQQQMAKIEAKGHSILRRARGLTINLGFLPDNVAVKFGFRNLSTVLDIVQETEQGLYDATVLGRRGVSWLEEAMGESVSRGLLDESPPTPIWMCRTPDLDREGVLLYMDGSPSSCRMADQLREKSPRHHAQGGAARTDRAGPFHRGNLRPGPRHSARKRFARCAGDRANNLRPLDLPRHH